MSEYVLDASAVLALLNQEPGWDQVELLIARSVLGSVNLCEVLGKLIDLGISAQDAKQAVEFLGLAIIDFDSDLAFTAAGLRHHTRNQGLSLGDRSCLALALSRSATVVTADKAWAKLKVGLKIEVVR